jgi:hypothetical protein
LAVGSITTARRLGLGLAGAVSFAAAAYGAEPVVPFELRAEGEFPLQHVETSTSKGSQNGTSAAPYLGLTGTANLSSDLSTSVFANVGHPQLGSFRDNDNTFASAGGNLVKRWGAGFSTGVSIEHTHYYDDAFGRTTNVANDINLFANYRWPTNKDLKVMTGVTVTARLDDAFAVERYSYGVRFNIEQRLFGSRWWVFATPRVRYSDYVGADSGRRDARFAIASGLRYEINEYVSAKILAGYENRQSNVASRNSDKFAFGASIDFDFDFVRPRWPAGR